MTITVDFFVKFVEVASGLKLRIFLHKFLKKKFIETFLKVVFFYDNFWAVIVDFSLNINKIWKVVIG